MEIFLLQTGEKFSQEGVAVVGAHCRIWLEVFREELGHIVMLNGNVPQLVSLRETLADSVGLGNLLAFLNKFLILRHLRSWLAILFQL